MKTKLETGHYLKTSGVYLQILIPFLVVLVALIASQYAFKSFLLIYYWTILPISILLSGANFLRNKLKKITYYRIENGSLLGLSIFEIQRQKIALSKIQGIYTHVNGKNIEITHSEGSPIEIAYDKEFLETLSYLIEHPKEIEQLTKSKPIELKKLVWEKLLDDSTYKIKSFAYPIMILLPILFIFIAKLITSPENAMLVSYIAIISSILFAILYISFLIHSYERIKSVEIEEDQLLFYSSRKAIVKTIDISSINSLYLIESRGEEEEKIEIALKDGGILNINYNMDLWNQIKSHIKL